MQHYMAILKDLRGYHHRGPEKSTDDHVGRSWPDANNPKSDLDGPSNCISRHYLRFNSQSIGEREHLIELK